MPRPEPTPLRAPAPFGLQGLDQFRAHPYFWGSLACHAIIAIGLLIADRVGVAGSAQVAPAPYRSPAVVRAEEDDLRRRVQVLERIKDGLQKADTAARPARDRNDDAGQTSQETDAKDAAALERKLRQLADEISQATLKEKAKELARVLKIPEPQALENLKKEMEAVATQPLDKLQQRAQDALAFHQRRLDKERNGTTLGRAPENQFSEVANWNRDRNAGTGAGSNISGDGRGGVLGTYVDGRNYGELVQPPPLDRARMQGGAGRIIGAQGRYADRIYVDSWYLIGPFPGHRGQSLADVYPPEHLIDLDAVYAGEGRRTLRWKYHQFARYPLIPPNAEEGAVYYGYTEIMMDEDRDVWLSMGADDDAKVWLDGEVLWTSGGNDKPWFHTHFKNLVTHIAELNLTEASRRVHLKKGRHTLLFKLYNGSGATFFSLVMAP